MYSESEFKQFVRAVLPNTVFILQISEIMGNLVDKSFDNQHMEIWDEA